MKITKKNSEPDKVMKRTVFTKICDVEMFYLQKNRLVR